MTKSLVELLEVDQEKYLEYKIFCDLDGVLTDFEGRFMSKLKEEGPKYYSKSELSQITTPEEFEKKFGKEEFWKFIDQYVGVGFWVGMEWMKGGKDLWNYIKQYNPTILSAPSRDPSSRLGKRLWVKNQISSQPKLIFAYSTEKQNYAAPNHILIDDKKSNIEQWRSAGGIGIRCVYGNIQPVIQELKQLLEK
jgi:hypothetical protein